MQNIDISPFINLQIHSRDDAELLEGDMFLEAFRVGACTISKLEQSPYKNVEYLFTSKNYFRDFVCRSVCL